MKRKKVILLSNTSWYLYNFKSKLIENLLKEGYELVLIAPFDKYTELFDKEITFKNWKLSRRSLNPLREIFSIYQLFLIYKSIQPDYCHHFTIKACIYGTIAAKICNAKNVLNAHTGLISTISTLKKTYLLPFRFIFYLVLKNFILDGNSINIFQNKEDFDQFNKLKGRKINQALIIPGSGVDTEFFKLKKTRKISKKKKSILFPARLIKEKGLQELILACKLLWKEGYNFQLNNNKTGEY